MKPTFFLTVILLFAALFLLSSCNSDEIITGSAPFSVKGTVLNTTGFPVYPAKVWLNYNAYVDVNADGTFLFNNVKMPYNLTVNKQWSTEFTVYEGLTSLSPRMYLSGGTSNLQNQAYMIVTLPKAPSNGKSSVTFLCKENVISGFQFIGSDTVLVSYIQWGGNNTRLEGKLAAIQFERGVNGQITAYNRFGFKDTAISAGETIYIQMKASDLPYNPPESSVNIIFWQGSNNGVYLDIVFDGYKSNSAIWLAGISGSNIPVSYVVPGMLPLDYSIRANVTYTGGYSQMFLVPGSIIHIPPVQPVNLLSPANGDSAGYNTDCVHDGTSDVYITMFAPLIYPPNFIFHVVSSSRSVRMPVLPFFGIYPSAGTQINWEVNGYNGFNGINDFASDKRVSNYQYSVVYSSGARHFYLK